MRVCRWGLIFGTPHRNVPDPERARRVHLARSEPDSQPQYQVEHFARESAIANGLCLVNPMHITAAVYVNYDERGLLQHIGVLLKGIVE
jgi:Uncharacterised protein family UPF0047